MAGSKTLEKSTLFRKNKQSENSDLLQEKKQCAKALIVMVMNKAWASQFTYADFVQIIKGDMAF